MGFKNKQNLGGGFFSSAVGNFVELSSLEGLFLTENRSFYVQAEVREGWVSLSVQPAALELANLLFDEQMN